MIGPPTNDAKSRKTTKPIEASASLSRLNRIQTSSQ